jgi:hypothetical protein
MNDGEPAGRRERLVAELTDVLGAASGERGDPGRVLADDALRPAGELAAVAEDEDGEAWSTIGRFIGFDVSDSVFSGDWPSRAVCGSCWRNRRMAAASRPLS